MSWKISSELLNTPSVIELFVLEKFAHTQRLGDSPRNLYDQQLLRNCQHRLVDSSGKCKITVTRPVLHRTRRIATAILLLSSLSADMCA